jgi:hypothetical protein
MLFLGLGTSLGSTLVPSVPLDLGQLCYLRNQALEESNL